MDVSAEDYARFQAYQAEQVERKSHRLAKQWVDWASEVGGDAQNILRAYTMATELIAEHAPGWELKFTDARKQDGCIKYRYAPGTRVWDGKPGTMPLSGPLMSLLTADQQRELILHEIAHACCPDDNHGPVWGWHCHRLGIPVQVHTPSGVPRVPARVRKPNPFAWSGICPAGHHTRLRASKPRGNHSCSTCSPGRYDEDALIVWEKVLR